MSNDTGPGPLTPADIQEIRDLFLRQAAGETAHDIGEIETVLAPAVNFVARAYSFWGRGAVIDHFRTVFAGTWRFEPDEAAIRILPLGPDAAHIYAPTRVTAGPAGQAASTHAYLVNEFAIRTDEGWRISAIIPVPTE